MAEKRIEMAEELLFRKDVKKELTWDLSLIYKDEDALMADAARLESFTAQLENCLLYTSPSPRDS